MEISSTTIANTISTQISVYQSAHLTILIHLVCWKDSTTLVFFESLLIKHAIISPCLLYVACSCSFYITLTSHLFLELVLNTHVGYNPLKQPHLGLTLSHTLSSRKKQSFRVTISSWRAFDSGSEEEEPIVTQGGCAFVVDNDNLFTGRLEGFLQERKA